MEGGGDKQVDINWQVIPFPENSVKMKPKIITLILFWKTGFFYQGGGGGAG